MNTSDNLSGAQSQEGFRSKPSYANRLNLCHHSWLARKQAEFDQNQKMVVFVGHSIGKTFNAYKPASIHEQGCQVGGVSSQAQDQGRLCQEHCRTFLQKVYEKAHYPK